MSYRFFQRPALVFSISVLTLLTALEVPAFVVTFCAILWFWKWLSEKNILQPLSRTTTTVLSFLALFFIYFQYKTIFSQESSSSLLLCLSAIKVMDYENRRDHLLLALLGFLLLTLKPLYGMDLLWLPVQLTCMLTLWWALSQNPRSVPSSQLLRVFASALPVALILFLIFPRVVLPWALSRAKPTTARMGFSSSLNPGQVAQLASSSELVFRVRFLSPVPVNPSVLYWKGARLTQSQGLAWSGAQGKFRNNSPPSSSINKEISYEVILEQGNGTLVFTLDPTYQLTSTDSAVYQQSSGIWRTSISNGKSLRFFGKSTLQSKDTVPPGEEDLQIPELPIRTLAWVKETLSRTQNFPEKKQALRELFSQNGFVYTLNPGTYDGQGLDEFLFQRRRGFCEHFAGAYATLARALGIPARVVSGYQGAEYNPMGEFWKVTQRQAHAWVEVWNGEFWERNDPTLLAPVSEFNRQQERGIFEWFNQASDAYETMNYKWTTFLIDFDRQSQVSLFQEWWPRLTLAGIIILLVFFLIRLLHSQKFTRRISSEERAQQQLAELIQKVKDFEQKFQQRDLSTVPPLQVLHLAENRQSENCEFYRRLSELYDKMAYQEKSEETPSREEIQNLQSQWNQIQRISDSTFPKTPSNPFPG